MSNRRAALALVATLAVGAQFSSAAEPRPTWVLCGRADLVAAAEPLAEYRRKSGRFEVIVAPGDPAAAVREHDPDYLLIIGDDLLGVDPEGTAGWVSSERRSLYRWRSTQSENFAADMALSGLDGERNEGFPVGRIPARTAQQVAVVVEKTIAFENAPRRFDDLSIPVWGGTPAYGKLLDEAATTLLLRIIRKETPPWAEPWVMFGNPRSPLSAHPPDQPEIFNQRLRRGGLIAAMIGHGGTSLFHSQATPDGNIDYTVEHARALTGDRPTCPLVIFACDCGNFAAPEASLAEALLFNPSGPVCVVGATTESHPLTNFYSAKSLLYVLRELATPDATFGEVWHQAQGHASKTRNRLIEALLKNAEGALEAEIDIPKLKSDQLLMYALLGDPATHLHFPELDGGGATPPRDIGEAAEDGELTWALDEEHGAKLQVAIRRPVVPPRVKPEGAPKELAMRLFEEMNASWSFEELSDQWQGSFIPPGRLRIALKAAPEAPPAPLRTRSYDFK